MRKSKAVQEKENVLQTDETVVESPRPADQVISDTEEKRLEAVLERINSGRILFEMKGETYSIRLPNGVETWQAQQVYAREFFKLVKDGVPSIAQIDIESILLPFQREEYEKKSALIEKGYYDYEKYYDVPDFELPEPEPVDQARISGAKLRLTLDILTRSPSTIMFLNNTAENLAQQRQTQYLTWVGLEKQENGKWVKAYQTFEEFMQLPDLLIEFFVSQRNELTSVDINFLSG